ncbi:hypothetical protein [Auraticoccus monumenti]|uniref:hypothetical protein n=1 Tax=Auraticoccus monumenti TaxID=675864 RepID=UPI000B8452DF|nr:hypothetical protein [Auraticoccus monumenti]
MNNLDSQALLTLFVSELAKLEDGLVVHGPAAETAGSAPVDFDPSSPSVFLDFEMDAFIALVEQLSEAISSSRAPHPWRNLPPGEAAVRAMLQHLTKRWSQGWPRASRERHFRLLLTDGSFSYFQPLRKGGPTLWLPPLSDAFVEEVGELEPCEPWSLDQLERFLWLLAGRRQFERSALLGAWPLDPGRFVCVLAHPGFGPVGVIVQQDPGSEVGLGASACQCGGRLRRSCCSTVLTSEVGVSRGG